MISETVCKLVKALIDGSSALFDTVSEPSIEVRALGLAPAAVRTFVSFGFDWQATTSSRAAAAEEQQQRSNAGRQYKCNDRSGQTEQMSRALIIHRL